MVKRLAGAVLGAAIALLALSAPARADIGEPGPPPPPPGGGGQSHGGSGAPVHTTAHACSLYATQTNFGASCIVGSANDVKTVKQILGKDRPPTCWDEAISTTDAKSLYGYDPNPDGRPYYLHSCITGLTLTNSLYYQPSLTLTQYVIVLPVDPHPCDIRKPFTDAMVGQCQMTLFGNQLQIVRFLDGRPAQIPGLLIVMRPSPTVHTNQDVAYVNIGKTPNGKPGERSVSVHVGHVTLTASMSRFFIQPYGPDGATRIPCDGSDPGVNGTRASAPRACWWNYPQSSAGQHGGVYPFRAEADWTVTYRFDGDATVHQLASFRKYADIRLPVNDIQTVVVR